MMDLGMLGGTLAFVNGINSPQSGRRRYPRWLGIKISILSFGTRESFTDLGTLGGNFVGSDSGSSDAGEVVGKAQLPGSLTRHEFPREEECFDDLTLGVWDGDPCSVAININAQAQIVGFSDDCSGNNQHAFLWEKRRMTDLNGFVPASSNFTLIQALFINDRGEDRRAGRAPQWRPSEPSC